MHYLFAFCGLVLSFLALIILSRKWKLSWPPSILGAAVFALIGSLPFFFLYPSFEYGALLFLSVFGQISFAVLLGLLYIFINFWRDPERKPPQVRNAILSAADGKIVYVNRTEEGCIPHAVKNGRKYYLNELMSTDLMTGVMYVIGIEMNLLDVHVTRCPLSGCVKLMNKVKGSYMSLGKVEAPFLNTRSTVIIENEVLIISVVMISSRLVRSIIEYLNVKDNVEAGQRLGMIRFGSLVAVVIPAIERLEIVVRPGQHVTAGETILAYINNEIG